MLVMTGKLRVLGFLIPFRSCLLWAHDGLLTILAELSAQNAESTFPDGAMGPSASC